MKPSLFVLALLTACSREGDESDLADARRFDAHLVDSAPVADARAGADGASAADAARSDAAAAADAPPGLAPHLLLTEIDSIGADEFVEIYNPTDATIDLRDYYLADVPSYFTLPAGAPSLNGDQTDFVVRFPAGATIAPRQVIVIATDGEQFDDTTYAGLVPTYSIDEAGAGTPMDRISYIAPSATQTGPALTNSGEMVALFTWDGASDRVHDVDLMLAGDSTFTTGNNLTLKTAVDGPDADTSPTAYATDAMSMLAMASDLTSPGTNTYARTAFEGADETHGGSGNGLLGDDETSEAIQTTWTIAATGTPGTVPESLR